MLSGFSFVNTFDFMVGFEQLKLKEKTIYLKMIKKGRSMQVATSTFPREPAV